MNVRNYPQMKIRLSPDLKAVIEKSAKKNNRTLNSEITAQLERAYKSTVSDFPLEELAELMREVIKEELSKNK